MTKRVLRYVVCLLALGSIGCGVSEQAQSTRVRALMEQCEQGGGRGEANYVAGGIEVTCYTRIYP